MSAKKISVIVACYNERDNLTEMHDRITAVFKKMGSSYECEIIYVDNNSEDDSEKILTKLARKDKRVKVLFTSRNFGSSQPSFLAGLKYASGNATVLLHGDIQDPPELIPAFIKKWEQGYQVVYGIRITRRGYGRLMNIFFKLFYKILNKLAYINIPVNAGEFSLIDKRVVRELLNIDEYDYYLRCLRAYVGFKQIGINYTRDARHQGRTGENFMSYLWWAKTIIVNFSFKPLEWISYIAFLIMLFSFLLIAINIVLYFILGNSPKGIPTIVFLILFLGGVQLLSLSVIAEYLAKIFLEVKRRPKYIIRRKINLP